MSKRRREETRWKVRPMYGGVSRKQEGKDQLNDGNLNLFSPHHSLDPTPPSPPPPEQPQPSSLPTNIRRTITNPRKTRIPYRPSPLTLHLEARSPTVTAAPRVLRIRPDNAMTWSTRWQKKSTGCFASANRRRNLNPCRNVGASCTRTRRVDTSLCPSAARSSLLTRIPSRL